MYFNFLVIPFLAYFSKLNCNLLQLIVYASYYFVKISNDLSRCKVLCKYVICCQLYLVGTNKRNFFVLLYTISLEVHGQ
jgi:hypothetical protein